VARVRLPLVPPHVCVDAVRRRPDVKHVQRWLGHSSPSFTLTTYVHLLPDEIAAPLDVAFASRLRAEVVESPPSAALVG
jgi:integrase